MNRNHVRRAVIGAAVCVLGVVGSRPLRGGGSPSPAEWTMIGQGVDNARSQPAEFQIGPSNVGRLAMFVDPQGAMFAILKPDPAMS